MSTEAFLSAIREEPDDDLHRLVYADWLDDHGDSDRAEFIRIQCRLAELSEYDPTRDELEIRERELLIQHERAWVTGLPKEVCGWRFRRGFVDEVTLPPEVFIREWDGLLARHPITGVRFPSQEEDFPAAELANCPGLEQLSGLGLSGCGLEEEDKGVEQLLTSPRLQRLRRLEVAENGLCYIGGEYLAGNPALAGLEELDFSCDGLNEPDSENALACFTGSNVLTSLVRLRLTDSRNHPVALLGLNDSPFRERLEMLDLWGSDRYDYEQVIPQLRLPRLRSLSLYGTTLGWAGATALLESPHLPAIMALNLSCRAIEWDTPSEDNLLRALYQSSGWARLEELELRHAHLTVAGLHDLAGASSKLRTIDLSGNRFGCEGVRTIASLPWLSSLSLLGLHDTGADDEAVTTLSLSPGVANIRVLWIGGNKGLTDVGVKALTRSRPLRQLVELDLDQTSLDKLDMEEFALLPRLARLRLRSTNLTASAVQSLARCSWLARITQLDLSWNRAIGNGLRSLAESPYLSPLCCLDIEGVETDDSTWEALRERLGWRLTE